MTDIQHILSRTATLVLAGGRGARLAPLTHTRSKPAVPFGDGRIVDFVLANCLRSNLNHPSIITQYQASHLTQHVGRWWLEQSARGAVASASPVCMPRPDREYRGTADALFRNIPLLDSKTRFVLILSADHIYNMDYRELLQFHVDRNADVTLSAVVHPGESSRQFGILEVDELDRVTGFEEKPARPKNLPGSPGYVLANMGIYVFGKEALLDALRNDADDHASDHDIGRNILPRLVKQQKLLSAFRFQDPNAGQSRYWKDVGTIDSYYEASMSWLNSLPVAHRLAGSGSLIGDDVRVHPTAEVTDSILMSGVTIGPRARIRKAIIDENVRVLAGAHIGCGAREGQTFACTSNGVTVVAANSIVRPAMRIVEAPGRMRVRLQRQIAR
jgi:glucose-1-phosphate adenylyltransferase